MSTCRRCGCICDPGDIRNGICDDCREEEKSLEIRREWYLKMRAQNIIEQPDGQLTICNQ